MMEGQSNTVKAGRIMRVLGWIGLVLSVLLILAVAFGSLTGASNDEEGAMFITLIALLGVGGAVLQLWIGAALQAYKGWARVVAVILSVMSLFNFPVGTVIALLILYYLIKGWDETGQTGFVA